MLRGMARRDHRLFLHSALLLGLAVPPGAPSAQAADAALLEPGSAEMRQQAPALFQVRLETSKGPVLVEVHRDWAPQGADRFYNLIRHGFYDDCRFFRVIAGRWAQFGIPSEPRVAGLWRDRTIADDPRRESNV